MDISEDQLREIVLRVLNDLAIGQTLSTQGSSHQKIYMMCDSVWSESYRELLHKCNQADGYCVYPVIPDVWRGAEYSKVFQAFSCCKEILYQSEQQPLDLKKPITIFPVVRQNIVVKTALCLCDSYETAWITECFRQGGRVVFLRSGMQKFSGMETNAYQQKIMDYYRTLMEYGIEFLTLQEFVRDRKQEKTKSQRCITLKKEVGEKIIKKKNRVITAANIESFAIGGILYMQPGDIVTSLARERARFLNIDFQQ